MIIYNIFKRISLHMRLQLCMHIIMFMVICQHVTFYWANIHTVQNGNTITYNIDYYDQSCSISKIYSNKYVGRIHKMTYDIGFISKHKIIAIPSRINKCDDVVTHFLDLNLISPFFEYNVLLVFLAQSVFYVIAWTAYM